MLVQLRPVHNEDDAFLFQVYADARSQEMSLAGWTPHQTEAFLQMQYDLQRRSYQMQFPQAEHFVILLNQMPVGRLILQRETNRIHLIDIALLSAHRNQGVGQRIIRQLQDEAAAAGKAIFLSVEARNQGAQRLYQRLGFTKAGNNDTHLFMEWRAIDP